MDAITLLTQKGVKKIEVREQLVSAIADGSFSLEDFKSRAGELNDKQTATFLEAVEAVTGKKLRLLSADYLHFAEQYILSDNNSCKREASRIVGNMAADYPEELETAVSALLKNTAAPTRSQESSCWSITETVGWFRRSGIFTKPRRKAA